MRACHRTICEWAFFRFGLQKMDVEVQEKQDALRGDLRSLESDDRRVLVNFDSPANSII
jgi:hypothetical protein